MVDLVMKNLIISRCASDEMIAALGVIWASWDENYQSVEDDKKNLYLIRSSEALSFLFLFHPIKFKVRTNWFHSKEDENWLIDESLALKVYAKIPVFFQDLAFCWHIWVLMHRSVEHWSLIFIFFQLKNQIPNSR